MQRKRSSYSAAAIIGGNDDVLTEILVLLPAKSLVRFRVVSKHLRSLIDTESFHHRHLMNRRRRRPQHQWILRSTVSPQFFICDLTAKTMLPLRLRFESQYRHVGILQSSHGLLLLECRKAPRGRILIRVCNPTTAQRRDLLDLPGDDSSRFCLMYDPSKSYGYTVFHFTYRRRFYYDTRTEIKVYNSRTKKWEMRGNFDETLERFPQGVLCNDRLYFIRPQSPSMCFSPDDLTISAVATPLRCRSSSRQRKYVVGSNGHLHYLVLSLKKSVKKKKSKNLLDVYEMTDDNCWVISNRVDSDRPLSATFDVDDIEVIGFVRGEREEDSTLVYHVLGKIMIYRFGDEVSEEIVDFSEVLYCEEGSLQFDFKDSHQFIESFASV